MIQIGDWKINAGNNLSNNNPVIYTAENGKEHLVRQQGKDMAIVIQSGNNINIIINGTSIFIEETKKSITISDVVKLPQK